MIKAKLFYARVGAQATIGVLIVEARHTYKELFYCVSKKEIASEGRLARSMGANGDASLVAL